MWIIENKEWIAGIIGSIVLFLGSVKIKRLNARLTQTEVDSANIKNLKEIIDTYREELTSLKSHFDNRVKEVLGHANELKTINSMLGEVIETHTITIDDLKSALKDVKEYVAELKVENESLKLVVDKLKATINDLKRYISKLEKENLKYKK